MYKQEYKVGMMKSSLQNRFNLDAFSRDICNKENSCDVNKVNSVQEAFVKCIGVHILKIEIL